MITKGPQLISKTNIPLLIPAWVVEAVYTDIKTALLVGVAMNVFIYTRAKEISMKSTALAVGI